MAEKTGIAWTDHTFNPWWGCLAVSPGCKNCYAEAFAKRTGHDIWGPAKTTPRRVFGPKHWAEPIRWDELALKEGRRRRVFCASMADVFEDHPTANEQRPQLWNLIGSTPWLDWQILTKRPENIRRMLPDNWGEGYENVWLGTSVEDGHRADERIAALLNVPAAIRFLSCEPLLGPVHLGYWIFGQPSTRRLHWIIVGGESGPHRRAMEMDWMRNIVETARNSGIAVFVKQDNAFKPDQRGRIPDDLWIREFPASVMELSELPSKDYSPATRASSEGR